MSVLAIDPLRELLQYDPATGQFRWIQERRGWRRLGNIAGSKNNQGYVHIRLRPHNLKAHRLAWAFMTDSWPDRFIDHLNGDRADNRWVNLRLASSSENRQNTLFSPPNSAGLVGAHRYRGHYRSVIEAQGVRYQLGSFATAEEAHAAYLVARATLHSRPIIDHQGEL